MPLPLPRQKACKLRLHLAKLVCHKGIHDPQREPFPSKNLTIASGRQSTSPIDLELPETNKGQTVGIVAKAAATR